MPNVIVPLLGSGTKDDPYRVNLPTWQGIGWNYPARQALVWVPDEDLPIHCQRATIAVPFACDHDADLMADWPDEVLQTMPPAQRLDSVACCIDVDEERWHDHLDERYQEHRGAFRPRLADHDAEALADIAFRPDRVEQWRKAHARRRANSGAGTPAAGSEGRNRSAEGPGHTR